MENIKERIQEFKGDILSKIVVIFLSGVLVGCLILSEGPIEVRTFFIIGLLAVTVLSLETLYSLIRLLAQATLIDEMETMRKLIKNEREE